MINPQRNRRPDSPKFVLEEEEQARAEIDDAMAEEARLRAALIASMRSVKRWNDEPRRESYQDLF
jgi:hypothetical protein